MKKTIIKRIIYHSPNSGDTFFGTTEYPGYLSDENILGAFHEEGKTAWIHGSLWVVRDDSLVWRLTVESFPQYEKSWFDLLLDAIRRI